MCGIAGKISFTNQPISERDIARMNDALRHRGPDDSGVYLSPDQRVGLGHRRLSIIDLSPRGRQPMSFRGRYWITYNGEIYNFQSKRAQLAKEGYTFSSDTDTEVILALYDRFGTGCVNHLRGMFAFAIFDEQRRQLFCARDRLGQKPFKYYYNGRVFIFASELKAILTQPEYHKEPDYLAIHHYLTLQYTPAPLTGFVGIRKLEPAHWLLLDIERNTVQQQQYWRLNFSAKLDLSERDWQDAIMHSLDETTRLQMIADVPLGAFLSGGIDSSAIVGLMSRHASRAVKTFSIGFKEKDYNELPFARTIAKHFNTEHTEFTVEPQSLDIVPLLVRHLEEPYADSSALPTYIVSELTRRHVTVALSGDGGDENFAGYGRYSIQKFALLYEKLRPLNAALALPITRLAARFIPHTFFERAYRFAGTLARDYPHRYVNYVCYFTNDAKQQLYQPALSARLAQHDSYNVIVERFHEAQTANKLDQTLYADIATILPDDFLTKWDIAAMACGLEVRSPFVDHEFMELAAKIPSRLKLRGANNRKYIFKEAVADLLPAEIIHRSKKGFQAPIDLWFKDAWRGFASDTLLSPRALRRGLFNPDAVASLVHKHNTTQLNESTRIWALLTLELWFREFFD